MSLWRVPQASAADLGLESKVSMPHDTNDSDNVYIVHYINCGH